MYNRPENLDIHRTSLPPRRFYGAEQKSPAERRKFLEWYAANRRQPFHLRTQLPAYCDRDVEILRLSCIKFRQILIDETDLDPFKVASTIG
jgi:hypothetical protein